MSRAFESSRTTTVWSKETFEKVFYFVCWSTHDIKGSLSKNYNSKKFLQTLIQVSVLLPVDFWKYLGRLEDSRRSAIKHLVRCRILDKSVFGESMRIHVCFLRSFVTARCFILSRGFYPFRGFPRMSVCDVVLRCLLLVFCLLTDWRAK